MSEPFARPWPAAQRRLRIGAIEIDLRYRRLLRPDAEIELAQRVFDLLLLFLAHPGVLQTRNEIFRQVWPGVVVEDANLTQSVWLLRRALGPQGKDWIRTVAKLGYVFDPPEPVQWPAEPLLAAAAPSAAVQSVVAAHRRHGAGWRLPAVGAAAALFLLLVGWWQVDAQPPRRVVLAAAADAALDDTAQWPVQLLQSWLEWKLAASSDVELADSSVDGGARRDDVVVLLSAGPAAGGVGEWQVGARLRGAGLQRDIVHEVLATQLVQALDSISRDVHAALAEADAAAAWPPLALDMAAAEQFVAGLHAAQRHRRADAVVQYRQVLDRYPEFGYARYRLAEELAELGQQGAVEAELPRLHSWLASLPAAARAGHDAQLLALAQDQDAAAAAFAALTRTSPFDTPQRRLAEARNLRRAGRSADALQRLGASAPAAPRRALPWLLERALSELAGGDAPRAAASASAAAALAQRLGWAHERGRALLLSADAAQAGAEGDAAALLQQAQQQFDAAGDRLGALRARHAATLLAGSEAERRTALDELLAEARAAGNVAVEFDALRRSAFQHYRSGEMARYDERLAQAAAVAETAGDRQARTLTSLDLLHQQLLEGDVAGAQRRLDTLAAQPLQGMAAHWVDHFSGWLAYTRGDYDQALRIVARSDRATVGAARRGAQTVGLDCLRGAVALSRGEATLARNAFADCRTPQQPHYLVFADIGEAELALHGGDRAGAQRHLAAARAALQGIRSSPDRSKLILDLAPLLARSGDLAAARELIQSQLDLLSRAGYAALLAEARLTLAEIALASGALDEAAAASAQSAAALAADNWQSQRRLRTVQAVLAQRRGDTDDAARRLEALDADARRHADVLAELRVHSIVETLPQAARCSTQRHQSLLVHSGLRGASDRWLLQGGDVAPQLAALHAEP